MDENKKDIEKLKLLNIAIKNSKAYNIDIKNNEKISIFTISILKKEIETKKETVNKKTLDQTINQILISIQELTKVVVKLNSKVDQIEIDVQMMNSKVDKLELNYQMMNSKIDNLELKLDQHIIEFQDFKLETNNKFNTLFSLPTITRELKNE